MNSPIPATSLNTTDAVPAPEPACVVCAHARAQRHRWPRKSGQRVRFYFISGALLVKGGCPVFGLVLTFSHSKKK